MSLTALGGILGECAEVTVLAHEDVHACNTFENPTAVVPVRETVSLEGDPVITVPAAGVVSVVVGKK